MSELDYLDPDDVIKANHTPLLEATRPNYRAEETPPPILLEDTPESSADSGRSGGRGDTSGKRRYGRTRPSQCDAVLIAQLDPNRPDLAKHAGEHALASGSQSEADDQGTGDEDEGDSDQESMNGMGDGEPAAKHPDAVQLMAQAMKASEVLKNRIVRDGGMRDRLESPPNDDKENAMKYEMSQPDSRPSTDVTEPPSPVVKLQKFDVRPPPLITAIRSPRRSFGDEGDSIATSPALAKFITHGSPDNILPKMQKSPPPNSISARSPEVTGQTLPSLKTALSMSEASSNGTSYHSAMSGHSPSMARPSPGQHMSGYGPSPASYTNPSPNTNGMSPPSMPTHRSYGWPHPPIRDGSQSTTTPSEYTSTHSQSIPTSAITNPSPVNSYPTPISAHQRQDSEGTPHANGASPPPTATTSPSPSNASTPAACPFPSRLNTSSTATRTSTPLPGHTSAPSQAATAGPAGRASSARTR